MFQTSGRGEGGGVPSGVCFTLLGVFVSPLGLWFFSPPGLCFSLLWGCVFLLCGCVFLLSSVVPSGFVFFSPLILFFLSSDFSCGKNMLDVHCDPRGVTST